MTPRKALLAGVVLASTLFVATQIGIARAASEPLWPASEPQSAGGPPAFRRLNEAQYKHSIELIFGADIAVPGRFEQPFRESGLTAIGDSKVVVSASGLEQYELRARSISAQVLAEDRRASAISCAPPSPAVFDEDCAAKFLRKYGRLLYRRPLSKVEASSVVALARASAVQSRDFYKGLQFGLSRLLASPKFIFRIEQGELNGKKAGVGRLDDYSLATRLSFFFWDAPPDAEMLDAAARGELRNKRALEKQIDRLIQSPRFEQGVRSFFSDMFGYEKFDGLTKDQALFPKFSSQLAKDAQEQALRTVFDHLITKQADYRELFTTKNTFINRNLGALYRVPVVEAGIDGWAPYTFGPNEPRAGLLTLAAFLMLDPTHEGRSSPTIRGKSVRELLLCQPVPVPPANVDFAVVNDNTNLQFRTARQRLAFHQENPACSGCHAITDPIGLSMENFDAVGSFRTQENGAVIDASGSFDDKLFTDAAGLSKLLSQSPEVPHCVVKRAYEYAVGREAVGPSEEAWLEYANRGFATERYRFPALMRLIARSHAFQAVSTPTNVSTR